MTRVRLRQHGVVLAIRGSHLARRRDGQAQFGRGDVSHAARRFAAPRPPRASSLVRLRRLGARRLQLLHLVAQLDAFEMLPGVEQQARRHRGAGGHAAPEILQPRRRHAARTSRELSIRLDCVNIRSSLMPEAPELSAVAIFSSTRIFALRARGLSCDFRVAGLNHFLGQDLEIACRGPDAETRASPPDLRASDN